MSSKQPSSPRPRSGSHAAPSPQAASLPAPPGDPPLLPVAFPGFSSWFCVRNISRIQRPRPRLVQTPVVCCLDDCDASLPGTEWGLRWLKRCRQEPREPVGPRLVLRVHLSPEGPTPGAWPTYVLQNHRHRPSVPAGPAFRLSRWLSLSFFWLGACRASLPPFLTSPMAPARPAGLARGWRPQRHSPGPAWPGHPRGDLTDGTCPSWQVSHKRFKHLHEAQRNVRPRSACCVGGRRASKALVPAQPG